jgi:AraC-like DNA-binding protein
MQIVENDCTVQSCARECHFRFDGYMNLATSKTRSARRTSLSVHQADGCHREVILGERFAWSFRSHYHAGDEIVHLHAGRALLRVRQTCRAVEAGETVMVPAGVVHRFEPLDAEGWGFTSQFVMPSGAQRSAAVAAIDDSGLLTRIKTLLAHRHSLRTDVAQIAGACTMSKGYLSRRFRHVAGTSLHDFHVLIAVHRAKAALKLGLSIVEAALDAGFYDQAHLTREFVRTYGFTPGAFRTAWLTAPPLDEVGRH